MQELLRAEARSNVLQCETRNWLPSNAQLEARVVFNASLSKLLLADDIDALNAGTYKYKIILF